MPYLILVCVPDIKMYTQGFIKGIVWHILFSILMYTVILLTKDLYVDPAVYTYMYM